MPRHSCALKNKKCDNGSCWEHLVRMPNGKALSICRSVEEINETIKDFYRYINIQR